MYFCPSDSWSSTERMVLQDILNAKSQGHHVLLYCLKDSFLDMKAKASKVTCVYQQWSLRSGMTRLSNRKLIQREIKQRKINVIHCYSIKVTLGIASCLRRNHSVALMYTQTRSLPRSYKFFWHRSNVHRIDRVIINSNNLVDNIMRNLGVSLRKICLCGQGVEVSNISTEKRYRLEQLLSTQHKSDYILATNIAIHESNFDKVKPLIQAVSCLNEVGPKKYILLLLLEGDWEETLFSPSLKRYIKEIGAENDIYLYSCDSSSDVTSDRIASLQYLVDLWICLESGELIEDYTLSSLVVGVPVLVPRNGISMEMFEKFGLIGETFKLDDVREIRDKSLKILTNLGRYQQALQDIHGFLNDYLDMESCKSSVESLYLSVVASRKRLVERRLKR